MLRRISKTIHCILSALLPQHARIPGVTSRDTERCGVHPQVANDCTVCFTNPGTSEMHFVAGLDSEPAMRPVLP